MIREAIILEHARDKDLLDIGCMGRTQKYKLWPQVKAVARTYTGIDVQTPNAPDVVQGNMEAQIRRVFDNLQAVAKAAGGDLNDIVKLNILLTDLAHFALVNEVMATYFKQPYPARAAVGVASLPKGVPVEMDAIMVLDS